MNPVQSTPDRQAFLSENIDPVVPEINWDEVVSYVQSTGDKKVWGKLSEEERKLYLQALSKWQGKSGIDVANRPDSAILGANIGGTNIPLITPESVLGGGALVRGFGKGKVAASGPGPAAAKAGVKLEKQGLGRVPREGGGIVKGSGQPATIEARLGKATPPGADPPNLERLGNSAFTETEKRAAMFGGAKAPGLAVKPNARIPLSTQEEVEQLIEEIMRGKTGGSLPNNAPRGARLRTPKGK